MDVVEQGRRDRSAWPGWLRAVAIAAVIGLGVLILTRSHLLSDQTRPAGQGADLARGSAGRTPARASASWSARATSALRGRLGTAAAGHPPGGPAQPGACPCGGAGRQRTRGRRRQRALPRQPGSRARRRADRPRRPGAGRVAGPSRLFVVQPFGGAAQAAPRSTLAPATTPTASRSRIDGTGRRRRMISCTGRQQPLLLARSTRSPRAGAGLGPGQRALRLTLRRWSAWSPPGCWGSRRRASCTIDRPDELRRAATSRS
jgi:hypothetical protein